MPSDNPIVPVSSQPDMGTQCVALPRKTKTSRLTPFKKIVLDGGVWLWFKKDLEKLGATSILSIPALLAFSFCTRPCLNSPGPLLNPGTAQSWGYCLETSQRITFHLELYRAVRSQPSGLFPSVWSNSRSELNVRKTLLTIFFLLLSRACVSSLDEAMSSQL